MSKIFHQLDKMKPVYDMADKVVMLLCKLLLIADILITSMAVAGRFISFIPDPAWSEELVLTFMSYMAVLSAALAIRHGAHIRMTAFDKWLPKGLVRGLDILSDVCVMAFGVVMIVYGFRFCAGPLARGFYVSIPTLSKFWLYFPIPLAGIAMIVFEIEALYNHIKAICLKGEVAK